QVAHRWRGGLPERAPIGGADRSKMYVLIKHHFVIRRDDTWPKVRTRGNRPSWRAILRGAGDERDSGVLWSVWRRSQLRDPVVHKREGTWASLLPEQAPITLVQCDELWLSFRHACLLEEECARHGVHDAAFCFQHASLIVVGGGRRY